MTTDQALEKLIKSFSHYYDVNVEGEGPFCVTAAFHSHDLHYFLTKRAPLGESEAHEYVYIVTEKILTLEEVEAFVHEAWIRGLDHVIPDKNHRSSDIVLIILSDYITDSAISYIRRCKLYKSYKFTFRGWSALKIAAYETSRDRVITNRRGRDLKKLFK